MIDMEVARTLFKLCFAGGFAAAMLIAMLILGLIFALRLWTLRDELKEISEDLMELMKWCSKEE